MQEWTRPGERKWDLDLVLIPAAGSLHPAADIRKSLSIILFLLLACVFMHTCSVYITYGKSATYMF
jgi:hypothetical protein